MHINRENSNSMGIKQDERAAKKEIGEGDLQEEKEEEEEEDEDEEEEEDEEKKEEEEEEEEERRDNALRLLKFLVRPSTSPSLQHPSLLPFFDAKICTSPPHPNPLSLPPSLPPSDQAWRAAGLVVCFLGTGMDRPLSLGDHHNVYGGREGGREGE